MTVKAVVCRKGTDVGTIDPTASLANAVKTLATHRIGALTITGADQQVDGILSERDIVRALAERGSSALEEPVGQVMTRRSWPAVKPTGVDHGTDGGRQVPTSAGRGARAVGRPHIDRGSC